MQHWAEAKTCQVCLRVLDVAAWYSWIHQEGVAGLTELRNNNELGIRAFAFLDPEGYQIEVQTADPDH
jgi:lactoylglutathione lyase